MRRAEGLAAMRGVVQQGPGSCARSAVPPNNAAAARELREREATRLYQQVDDDRLGRCLEQESDEADEDAMVLAQFTPGMQLDSLRCAVIRTWCCASPTHGATSVGVRRHGYRVLGAARRAAGGRCDGDSSSSEPRGSDTFAGSCAFARGSAAAATVFCMRIVLSSGCADAVPSSTHLRAVLGQGEASACVPGGEVS